MRKVVNREVGRRNSRAYKSYFDIKVCYVVCIITSNHNESTSHVTTITKNIFAFRMSVTFLSPVKGASFDQDK